MSAGDPADLTNLGYRLFNIVILELVRRRATRFERTILAADARALTPSDAELHFSVDLYLRTEANEATKTQTSESLAADESALVAGRKTQLVIE